MRIDSADLIFAGRGSSALWAILKSLNKSNAKVLLPVNICEIIYPLVIKAGYEPVFYDVNDKNGNAGLHNIQEAFTGNETVLIAVHNFGTPLEIDEIAAWAKENNIFLIEDVCNAIGATTKGKPLGIFGDAAFFSFGYAKIVEHGFGGAAFIKDPVLKLRVKNIISSLEEYSEYHKNKDVEYQRTLRELRHEVLAQRPSVYLPLYQDYSNYLLYKINAKTEMEIKQLLENLDRNIEERAQKALRYRKEINSDKAKHIDEISGQVYWRYNLLLAPEIRNNLILELRKNNIFASTWYPPIIELFKNNVDPKMYPGSRIFGQRIMNLFVDHRVSQTDVSTTIEIINKFS